MTLAFLRRGAACALAAAVVSLGAAAAQRDGARRAEPPSGAFAERDLRAWLTYLASDELQGRQVYTEGLGLAAAYIARQLEQFGVAPFGDQAGYYQTVTVQGVRTRSRSHVVVTVNGRARTFQDGAGVTFPRNQGGRQTVAGRVAFVGHGVRFAPLQHDDFAGRNAAGAIALYIGRKGPNGFTSTHSRLLNARARNAIETAGAIAAVGPTPAAPAPATPPAAPRGAGATPANTEAAATRPAQPAAPPAGQPAAQPAAQPAPAQRAAQPDFQTSQRLDTLVPPQITAGDEFFEFVFSASGQSYADLKARAERQEALPAVTLGDVTMSIVVDADYDVVQTRFTRNVVGIVRGSDRTLADTYVMLGAHYDHIGYRQQGLPPATGADPLIASCAGQTRPRPRDGDTIDNGADDDGSGTVGLMAIAKAFATGKRPRRSVIFVWHTAEEGGLMGSRYMADHPSVPLDRVAAQLNIDMIGRNRCDRPEEANTVYLVGSDRISTELHNLNEEANASLRQPLRLDYELNDGADLESIYTRSDHYSYAAKGVPIIFFTTGLHRDYHYVTDEVDKILFPKLGRVAQLVYATAWRLSDAETMPARDRLGPRVGKGQSGRITGTR